MKSLWWLPRRNPRQRRAAMTLTELLVVFAIIAILAALYLPALFKALVRVKHFFSGF